MNAKKKIPARIAGYLLLFLLTYAILLGLFLLSIKCIPRERIRQNLLSSAEFLKDKEPLAMDIKGVVASRRDYVCDPYFLNILYYQDADQAVRSVAEAPYFYEDNSLSTKSFYKAVTESPTPNTEYLRYWHGGTAVVRVLLLWLDLPGIYRLFAVVLALLFAVLSALLLWERQADIWLCLCACFAAGSLWFSANAAEYIWCAVIMLVFCIAATLLCRKGRERFFPAAFLLSGILINFLDFLTYETVTLTVPMILSCALLLKKGKDVKKTAVLSARSAALWLCGYVGMWAGKWAFAAAVLHKNVMPYVTGHIEERLVGDAPLPENYLLGTLEMLRREFATLFPFGYGKGGLTAGIIALIVFACFFFAFHRKGADKKVLLLYFFWSLVPIIRFLVLRNHTSTHVAYTFRALMGSVFAWALMAAEGITGAPGKRK